MSPSPGPGLATERWHGYACALDRVAVRRYEHDTNPVLRETRVRAATAALVLHAFLLAGVAHAQTTGSISIDAQPVLHLREGKVHGCGVRLTGGAAGKAASSWFDVSFNVFRRGLGIAQSIAYEIRRSEFEGDSRPAMVPVQSTWLKAAEGGARLGENTERRNTLIYTMVMDDVLNLFEALAKGEAIAIGIKHWGQRVDAVYTGAPVLSIDSRQRISSCLEDLGRE